MRRMNSAVRINDCKEIQCIAKSGIKKVWESLTETKGLKGEHRLLLYLLCSFRFARFLLEACMQGAKALISVRAVCPSDLK
jgi:hypothetical protein